MPSLRTLRFTLVADGTINNANTPDDHALGRVLRAGALVPCAAPAAPKAKAGKG
jgi:hypothetical protein